MKKIFLAILILSSFVSSSQLQKQHFGKYRFDSLYSSLGIRVDTTAFKPVMIDVNGKFFKGHWFPTGAGVGGSQTLDQTLVLGNTTDEDIVSTGDIDAVRITASSSLTVLNGGTGSVELAATGVTGAVALTLPTVSGQIARVAQIPTNNNTLTNGAGYINSETQTWASVMALGNTTTANPTLLGSRIDYKDAGNTTLYGYTQIESDGDYVVQTNSGATRGMLFQTSTLGAIRTYVMPDANESIQGAANTATLSNKTLALGSNAVSGTIAQFNTAVTDADLATLAGTETLTNKRITKRVSTSATGNTTPTPNADNDDTYIATGMTVNMVFGAPTGTPTGAQSILIRIKDNGTIRTIGWNAVYRVIDVVLPTTTVANKTIYVGCVWNTTDSVWDVVTVLNQQ